MLRFADTGIQTYQNLIIERAVILCCPCLQPVFQVARKADSEPGHRFFRFDEGGIDREIAHGFRHLFFQTQGNLSVDGITIAFCLYGQKLL